MTDRGRDWRTILLVVGAAAGAFLAAGLAASMAFYAALSPNGMSLRGQLAAPLDIVIPATAILFMGALVIPAAYHSIRYLVDGANPNSLAPRLRIWQGLLLFVVWVGCAVMAGYLVGKGLWKWATPLLYLAAVCMPVYILLRIVTGDLSVGSTRRFWGIFTTGMVAGPAFAVFVELGIVVVLAVGAVIFLSVNPGQLTALQELVTQLGEVTSQESALELIKPLAQSPIPFVVALIFFSGLAPLIEEAAKSIAVWAVVDRLGSAAEGFLAGALSGAGFGLMESLLASASPDASWSATLLVRGGSSMMHIAAASLTGWGIARFHLTRRLGPLLGGYAAAALLHSLWNAAVVSIAFGSLLLALKSGSTVLATILAAVGGSLLAALCVSIPIALIVANRRFRSGSQSGLSQSSAPSSSKAHV